MSDTNEEHEADATQDIHERRDQASPAADESKKQDPTGENPSSPSSRESTDPALPVFADDGEKSDEELDADHEKTAAVSLEELGIIPDASEATLEPIQADAPAVEDESLEADRTLMGVHVDPALGAKQLTLPESLDESDATIARPRPKSLNASVPPGPPPLPIDADAEASDPGVEEPKGSHPTSTSTNARPPSMQASTSTVAGSPMGRAAQSPARPPAPAKPKPAPPERHRQKEESFSGMDAAEGRTMMFDAAMLHAAASAEPQGVLIAVEGPDLGKEFFLRSASALIGRSLECDLVINDSSVSRKHCRIDRRDGQHTIVDLGSGNGTRVNGERVTKCALEERAQIHVGTTVLQFELVGSENRAGKDPLPSNRFLPLATRFMGVFLVGALLVGAFLVGNHYQWWQESEKTRKSSKPVSVAVSDPDINDIQLLLAEKDLEAASSALREARKEYGNVDDLNDLSTRLRDARRDQKTISKHREALNSGGKTVSEYQAIIRSLEIIPTDSPFYSDATMLTESANDAIVESLKDEAYQLQTKGLYAKALAKVERVLVFKPNDSEAAYHKEQLQTKVSGVVQAPEEPQDSEKSSSKIAAREERKQRKKERVSGTKSTTRSATSRSEEKKRNKKDSSRPVATDAAAPTPNVGSKMAPMRTGFRLYAQGQFSAAASHFDRIANNSDYLQRDRTTAKRKAKYIRSFSDKYTRGKQASESGFSTAIPLLKSALSMNRKVNNSGKYSGEIRSMLANMYAAQATRALNNQDYSRAASEAKKALRYVKKHPTALFVLQKTRKSSGAQEVRAKETKTKEVKVKEAPVKTNYASDLARARDAKNRGNYGSAKRILRKVIKAAGSKSSAGRDASRLLNQILVDEADQEDD